MKKILTLILLAASASGLYAQGLYEGLIFSQNTYYGTARSMALGNAMTAVGGDLGSIVINPAGSAVSSYSQFTISPSLTISSSKAGYAAISGTDPYGNEGTSRYTRFNMPNIGLNLRYDTGQKYGLKSMSFGIVANGTNNYTSRIIAGGVNNATTYSGALAWDATNGGYAPSVLNSRDSYDRHSAPWALINGYRGGIIGDMPQNRYIGSAEVIYPNGDISIGGPIDQTYGLQTYGSKYDIDLNWGFHVDDQWFFGVNIGIQGLNYQYDEYIKEFARDPSQFPMEVDGVPTEFHNLRYRYSYNASGSGINAKIGVLYVPGNGLRLGAAIQTPTALTIRERWKYAADTHFTSSSLDCNETSPEGRYDYNFRAPYRVNAGVAYTYENIAMVSVDYELCDYSTMRFFSRDGYDDDFSEANSDIRDLTGISHMLRAGVELKPVPEFAIRTGYNLTSLPESYYDEHHSKHTDTYMTHMVSFGLGYSSPGSFFADIAARYVFYPKEYVRPYGDYLYDGNVLKTASPEIESSRTKLNLVLTLGFRF